MQKYLELVDDGLPLLEMKPWAKIKLDYLTRYINVFETSMREKWAERNYIDLLSGPGKVKLEGLNTIILGSPLIALTTRYPFTSFYFGDLSNKFTSALKTRCSSSPNNNLVNILTGDCNIVIDSILPRLKKNEGHSLNLAFLDPRGFELHWTTVAKLASIKRMDLIIYYPEMGLNRNMKKEYLSPKRNAIDQFFGGQEWREIYKNWLNRRGVHRQLIDLYKSKLIALGYEDVRFSDNEIGNEPLIRNIKKNAHLYRLIFASKKALGHKFWQEVTRRDVYGQRKLFD